MAISERPPQDGRRYPSIESMYSGAMSENLPWTPERAWTAAKLWVEEKKTASEIAAILSGTTRHAVNNKLRLMGIVRTTQKIPAGLNTGFVTSDQLSRHHCRFPLWPDQECPNGGKFCGRHKVGKSSYCEEHHHKTVSRTPKSWPFIPRD